MTPPDTTPDRSLIQRRLTQLKGKRAVIAMVDQRAFKGTIIDHDDEWVALADVSEGSTVNSRGWEEVTIHTGYVGKRLTSQGVFSEGDGGEVLRVKDTLIRLDHVLRIWEWESGNLEVPKHTRVESSRAVF